MTITPGIYRPGQPGYIAPGSHEHSSFITPSKVASILGESRWESPYSLWNRMKGFLPPEEPKTIFDIGHDIEPYIANRWRRLNPGWRISSSEVQIVRDSADLGVGFPAAVTLDRRATRGRARRIVEGKCARDIADLEKWGDDLSGDCPADYWVQVQAQMLFSGWTKYPAHLLAIGPYWNERIYEIEPDQTVFRLIIEECQRFWESLACDDPPPLDDSVATYETVRKLHPAIDADSTVQLDDDVAVEFLDAHAAQKDADKRLTGAKSRVLAAMGSAETALVGSVPIGKRTPHASGSVAFTKARKTTVADLIPAIERASA